VAAAAAHNVAPAGSYQGLEIADAEESSNVTKYKRSTHRQRVSLTPDAAEGPARPPAPTGFLDLGMLLSQPVSFVHTRSDPYVKDTCCCKFDVDECWSKGKGTRYIPELRACCKPRETCLYDPDDDKPENHRYDMELAVVDQQEEYNHRTCKPMSSCCCKTDVDKCWSNKGAYIGAIRSCCKAREDCEYSDPEDDHNKRNKYDTHISSVEHARAVDYDIQTCDFIGGYETEQDKSALHGACKAAKRHRRHQQRKAIAVYVALGTGTALLTGVVAVVGASVALSAGTASAVTSAAGGGVNVAYSAAALAAPSSVMGGATGAGLGHAAGLANARATDAVVYGNHQPLCCCGQSRREGLVCAFTTGRECPKSEKYMPEMCEFPEMIDYSAKHTIRGCQCRDFNHCMTNPPHNGHAWCKVTKEKRCGKKGKNPYTNARWDYCMVNGDPLNVVFGTNVTGVDALASFIPNELIEEKISSGVDSVNGVVSLGGGLMASEKCFVGEVLGSLSKCAQKCLDVGSPYIQKKNGEYIKHEPEPCYAFAYAPKEKYCITLPKYAMKSMFRPIVSSFVVPDGYIHYANKFHVTMDDGLAGESCTQKTLGLIQKMGYAVQRDKNNGRLYATKTATEYKAKVSCINDECGYNDWCFVQDGCGAWFNGCHPICPKPALDDIAAKGYELVEDKKNGHAYIQCPGSEDKRKISCISEECHDNGEEWCFVPNGCSSSQGECDNELVTLPPLECSPGGA